ncbi:hypothetical protein RRG08_005937, partial [Elysia crispata]
VQLLAVCVWEIDIFQHKRQVTTGQGGVLHFLAHQRRVLRWTHLGRDHTKPAAYHTRLVGQSYMHDRDDGAYIQIGLRGGAYKPVSIHDELTGRQPFLLPTVKSCYSLGRCQKTTVAGGLGGDFRTIRLEVSAGWGVLRSFDKLGVSRPQLAVRSFGLQVYHIRERRESPPTSSAETLVKCGKFVIGGQQLHEAVGLWVDPYEI